MESDERFKNELENATAGVASLTFKPRSSRDEAGTTMTSAEKTNTHCTTPSASIINSDRARFNELVTQGKEKTRQGDLYGALEHYQKAFKIHKSQKLAQKIEKLKEFIQENEEEEEEDDDEVDDGMVDVGNGFRLAANIHEALYPYQKEAILWFWGLYNQKKGGILGDDMGLGKTIQVISFLSGMFDAELIKSALIVMPVSVLENWEKEWKKWSPGIRVKAFHGSSKKERNRNLEKVQKKDGVCLTTYGMVVSNLETLSQDWRGRDFKWDYIILDEGHKIKNTTKTSKNVRAIPAEHHFILTGTPVQNNLREMWALFDFVCEGKLLGTSRTFKAEYENPIVRARERDASAYEKRIGNEMSESLRKLIEPHFLRRTKAMVLEKGIKVKKENMGGAGEDEPDSTVKMPTKLTRKNDLIVWLFMSKTQIQIYRDFLGSERVKEILMTTRSPLVELNVLKKITDHPRLLSAMACSQLGLNENNSTFGVDEDKENIDSSQDRSIVHEQGEEGPSDSTLIHESGKMLFLITLLDNLKAEGHRCLVFSQSRKMLDIIQRVIKHRGHKVLRIDGTISKTAERQHLITTFQNDPSYSCFLLTTQVGGVGITLTAADRVVIFDPSWNPATDAQAVDRVYRIGQKRTVVIYRLITCGSIEEKIYRKQVFKDALMKQTTGCSKNPFRYFTRQDLRDLFTLDDPKKSATQLQLEQMHAHNRKTDELLDKHIHFLHTLNIFGISDHDLMYSQEAVVTEDEIAESGSHDAIHARVLRAQNMVAAESGIAGMRPPTGFEPPKHPKAINQQGPSQTTGNGPIDWPRISAREKVQAALQQYQMFKPKREDNNRFVLSSGPHRSDPKVPSPEVREEVIDLSSPPRTPSEGSPTGFRTPTRPSSDHVVDLVELEDGPNEKQLEKSFSSMKLDTPDTGESQNCDNGVHSTEEVNDEAVDRSDATSGSESDYHDAVNEFPGNNSRGETQTLVSPQLGKTVPAASRTEYVDNATAEVHGNAVSIVVGDGDTSGASSVTDNDSEDGGEFVPKTDTASSPIFNNSLGNQSSFAFESKTGTTGSESLNNLEDRADETGFRKGSPFDIDERKETFDSGEESDDDQDKSSEDISPEASSFDHKRNSRRRIISSDSEEESDSSCKNTNSSAEKRYSFEDVRELQQQISSNNTREEIDNGSDIVNESTSLEGILSPQHLQNMHSNSDVVLENCDNSYPPSVSNEDGSGIEEGSANNIESGDMIEETSSPEFHHAKSNELQTQSKTTFQKETIEKAIQLPHHRESVDDEIVSVPQSARNRHRVKRLIVSDDEDDNDDEDDIDDDERDIEVKPVNDHRKSSSRRRSQIVYLSSSDESDMDSEEDSEAVVAEEESGRDDEISDRSDAANQSQVEVFGSEEDNSSLASSLKSTSLDQPSYKENSSKEDQFDQEMVSISGSPRANQRKTDSRCPTGKHASEVVNVNRCPCVTTAEEIRRYKEYLIKGRELEEEGKGEEALWQYLAALEVQDSDVRLHKKILVLQKKLELQ